ncbi:hypothetical protein H0W80_05255 [Candidatus Saccharibacteria bacterium]|nr:hypothetical protein [Candidatus Saccharibacteria bacterium]
MEQDSTEQNSKPLPDNIGAQVRCYKEVYCGYDILRSLTAKDMKKIGFANMHKNNIARYIDLVPMIDTNRNNLAIITCSRHYRVLAEGLRNLCKNGNTHEYTQHQSNKVMFSSQAIGVYLQFGILMHESW